jgi:hypothetical protein
MVESRLGEQSIFRLLAAEGDRLFPDEAFSDLFKQVGRRSVPPRIVATVMVLQRIEGLSDREAVDRFTFDMRWKYAAGGLDYDYPGFVHTVLVDMRERLRRSARPNRIFEAVLEVAVVAGLVGRKRVLDSTALYDAVATQDTVTLMRSAIRGVLRVAGALAERVRAVLQRDDDYTTAGKPACEWDDEAAREEMIDALARDGFAVLAFLEEKELDSQLQQACSLLAAVLGQDLEQREDGTFVIARHVAADRIISTVDPEARHGHKTAARGFDGYKGHVAVDPDSEVITASAVTAGNVADGEAAEVLLNDLLSESKEQARTKGAAEVYGDASYGTADLVEKLEAAGIDPNTKVQAPSARAGMYSQDAFTIDTEAGTARCPNGVVVRLQVLPNGAAYGRFAENCSDCPLRSECTTSKSGRIVQIHPQHETLHRTRHRQANPLWRQRYRATRPKVERKLAHMMRRKHGGRRARVRGGMRVAADFALLAASVNLQRLAALGTRWLDGVWHYSNPA